MRAKKIILIGAGGHCKSCMDVIASAGEYAIESIVDVPEKSGHKILSSYISATDEDIPRLVKNKDCTFLITLGQIKTPDRRKELYLFLKELGATLAVVISKSAYVSSYSQIGDGTIVMHNALVNADSSIGSNSIINTGALIEHDCVIGSNVHVSTQSIVNGGCTIGEGTFIGSNSVINNNISIVSGVVIGSGSVVIRNITEEGVYAGNPAKRIF
ncbi:acetyltransferase [Arcticibacter tournemirensis]